MFTLFVNRSRGGVTTFGVVVNALVVSTLLPCSVILWGATPAHAEEASVPLRLSRHTPINEYQTEPVADAVGEDAGIGDVGLPDPRSVDRHESSQPEDAVSRLPREQRIRLARFLPESKDAVDGMQPLDTLLAKAYTVRSSREGKDRGAIRVYRSGKEVPQGATTAVEGESEASTSSVPASSSPSAEQLLAEGDVFLAQSSVSDAFLSYFAVVNAWPDSTESLSVDAALNNLIWDAERGLANLEELRAFTDALPAYEECASDKAVYWLVAAHQVTGHALLASGAGEAARAYLEYGRDAALSAMQDHPDSPYQLFIPGHYLLSCRDLGRSELDTGMARLNQVISGEESNSMLKFAARHSLATQYNREYNDIVEGSVQVMNVVDEYPGSIPDQALQAETTSPNIRAYLNFGLGYIHYQMGQFGTARRYFESVALADSGAIQGQTTK